MNRYSNCESSRSTSRSRSRSISSSRSSSRRLRSSSSSSSSMPATSNRIVEQQLFTPPSERNGGSMWAPVDVGIQGSFADPPPNHPSHHILRSDDGSSISSSLSSSSSSDLGGGDEDEKKVLRQEQAELNQEMAVLLDIFDRLEVALRNKRDDEASPTNESTASSLHRSASFTSQASSVAASGGNFVSPLQRASSLRGLLSPAEATTGGDEMMSPSLLMLRSPSMRGINHPRQSIITLEEPDPHLTHDFSPELLQLRDLMREGRESLHEGHRAVAVVSNIHAVNQQFRILRKENKQLEAEYEAINREGEAYPEEILDLGNNDIARVAAHHQQELSRLQEAYKGWKAQTEESKRLADAEQHKLNALMHKIEFQADHGLRRGETVEDARRMSLLEAKLIDELKYAVHVAGVHLRQVQVLKESRAIVAKFKSLTPEPRRGAGGGLQLSPGGAKTTSKRRGGDEDVATGSPVWAARQKPENPFVSKLFAPENGQEARLLRLRKGALLLKTAPV